MPRPLNRSASKADNHSHSDDFDDYAPHETSPNEYSNAPRNGFEGNDKPRRRSAASGSNLPETRGETRGTNSRKTRALGEFDAENPGESRFSRDANRDADDFYEDDFYTDDFPETRAAAPRNSSRRPSMLQDGALRPSSLRDAARRASISSDERSDFRDRNASNERASAKSSTRNAQSSGARGNERNSERGAKRSDSVRGNSTRSGANSSREKSSKSLLKNSVPRTPPRALWYEIGGVLSLATGALLLWNTQLATSEIRGALPHFAVGLLRALFGIGAVIVPILLCVLGVLLIARHHRANLRAFWRGALVAFLVLLTATHLAVPQGQEFADPATISSHGGFLGGFLAWLLRKAVGNVGAVISLVAFSIVAVLLWSELSLAQTLARARSIFRRTVHIVRERANGHQTEEFYDDGIEQIDGDWQDPQENRPLSRRETRALQNAAQNAAAAPIEYSNSDKNARRPLFMSVDDLIREGAPQIPTTDETSKVETQNVEVETVEVAPDLSPKIEFTDTPPPTSVLDLAPPEALPQPSFRVLETPIPASILPVSSDDEMTPTEKLEAQALASATEGEAPVRAPRIEKPRRRFGDGPLMPEYFDDAVRALDPPVIPDLEGAEDDIHAGVKAVTETLASFKIDARVTDVKRGPVITRYEVQPAPGVRVATIAALDRDMSRALSAIAVRIEAPVPGKDIIGIEVPNKKVNLVRLRDVLERHDFLSTQSKLAFVLGKDIAGQPKWADLTKMPHMLVAGATNSGKSVCLNSIIASILVRATPEEVKFSLIDPKRVELTLFNGIKHLYHPVVVEPKDAVKVLRGMIAEMDRRYKLFAERGVRNIVSHNSKLEEGEAPLPYIVIVIDELADLMMTAAAEFEKLICRLAQLARATGIHLIVATQRPSVNVITGVIKANIPSRIAFAVASQVDSRTILDSMGAERLIGSGDMLFDANNGGKAIRIQGAFLSEEEVNRVVDVVKAAYADDETPMEYGLDITMVDADDVNEANEKTVARSEKKDELYEEILEYVVRSTEMSASMIQRKFEIGYPRAARIVDQFERDGVLSPANGSKPRKVIGNGRGVSIN